MDVLLIATHCGRKPFFLARSDVFKGSFLKQIFTFLRMIPIYRQRDGRGSLKYNQEIFDRCGNLFGQGHALVMFPEANHNIKRRVRKLSKGFVRISFNALEKHPELDLCLLPVGFNYISNTGFPDRVALYFDTGIEMSQMKVDQHTVKTANGLKMLVFDRLKKLTTHIDSEENYGHVVRQLNANGVDYLDPAETNERINIGFDLKSDFYEESRERGNRLWKWLFSVVNFPIVLPWRLWIKPRVWEPEFTATLRFGFALLVYPLYYALLFCVASLVWNLGVGLALILALFLFNWGYVKKARP